MVMEMGLLIVVLTLASLPYFVYPDAQVGALYDLKTSLNASSSQLTDWHSNIVNPCTWSKISCDSNNFVISVVLPYMGFSGNLTPRIGILKTLTTLDLQGNDITGEIPKDLGNLTSLTMLNLKNNRLTGEIPSSFGDLKALTFLDLSENSLSGSIPESLTSLPNLTDLELGSNNLSGEVPEQLFKVFKYNLSENHLDCGIKHFPSCVSLNAGHKSKPKTGIIVGIVLAVLVLLVLVGCLVLIRSKRGKKGLRGGFHAGVSG